MTAELTSLRKAAIDNAKESESLRTALQQLKKSTEQIQSDQVNTKRAVETNHSELKQSISVMSTQLLLFGAKAEKQ